jgi:protoporphyrinogen oxidase
MSDEDLRDLVLAALARAGAPVVSAVRRVVSRRLTHAYPIYDRAFHAHLDSLDGWVRSLDGILTVGRQGLFVHDNTHHTLAMAYAAVDCLRSDGSLDADRWAAARRSFEQHVVED